MSNSGSGECSCSPPIGQVVDAGAEQPHRPRAGVGPVEQRDRARGHARRGRASRCRVAAGDGREVVVAHLDRHRARAAARLRSSHRRCRAPSRSTSSRMRSRSVRSSAYVHLARRRLGGTIGSTGRSSSPAASLLQPVVMLPTAARSSVGIGRPHVDEPFDAALARAAARSRAHAPQRVDRQLSAGNDSTRSGAITVRPSGLRQRRRDLREELVRRDARRGGEPGPSRIARLHALRDAHAERLAPAVLGDVEVGLVERQRLDERRHRRGRWRRPAATPRGTSGSPAERSTRCGHSRTARDIGIADRTPNVPRLVARGRDHAAAGRAGRRRRPACRAARARRAVRPTRRTRPCRREGCGGGASSVGRR